MKNLFTALVLLLTLCSCVQPTTRRPPIPTVASHDMKKLRREINKYAQDTAYNRLERVRNIHFDIIKSTGQELCDRKLVPNTGVYFLKLDKFNSKKWFNSAYAIEKTEYEDVAKIFKKRTNDIWVQFVYKNSNAAKAGIKKGDKLISINSVNAPTGEYAFAQLDNIILRSAKDGLPIEMEVERDGKLLNFSYEPDMVCPYPIYIDNASRQINAFANGNEIYLTSEIIDYIQDDTILAGVIAHELAHNTLGHSDAQEKNTGIGLLVGFVIDIFTRGNGVATASAASAGALAYSKEFEMEADYISVYYMARAGYDYKKTKDVQKALAARNYWSIYQDGETHPTPSARYALMIETANEIDIKKAFNEELMPEFKVGNQWLKNKK